MKISNSIPAIVSFFSLSVSIALAVDVPNTQRVANTRALESSSTVDVANNPALEDEKERRKPSHYKKALRGRLNTINSEDTTIATAATTINENHSTHGSEEAVARRRDLATAQVTKTQALAKYEALWKSKAIKNYSYTMDNTGSNNNNIVYPWEVTVRNRVQAAGKDGNGNSILYKNPHPSSMEEHFQRIHNALRDGAKYIEVSYDSQYGYPVDIYIVYNDDITHSTYALEIYNFRIQ